MKPPSPFRLPARRRLARRAYRARMMRERVRMAERRRRLRDEVGSSITHGVGLFASVAAVPVLITFGALNGSARHVTGFAIYGVCLIALYAASTVYHVVRKPRWKQILRSIDHAAIFLLIAGTYTPVLLVSLWGAWGISLLAVVWTMAAVGVAFKLFYTGRFVVVSTLMYVAMGWIIVIAAKPALAALSPGALALLVAGGLCYTGGVVFFLWERLPYNHTIWHLFVMAGSVCHFVAIARYL